MVHTHTYISAWISARCVPCTQELLKQKFHVFFVFFFTHPCHCGFMYCMFKLWLDPQQPCSLSFLCRELFLLIVTALVASWFLPRGYCKGEVSSLSLILASKAPQNKMEHHTHRVHQNSKGILVYNSSMGLLFWKWVLCFSQHQLKMYL